MSLRDAAEALLNDYDNTEPGDGVIIARWPQMETLREALAEAEKAKPVAWCKPCSPADVNDRRVYLAQDYEHSGGYGMSKESALSLGWTPLFGHPPASEVEPVLPIDHRELTGALGALNALFAENELPMTDRNGVLYDTIRAELVREEKADVPHHCTPEQIDDTDWRSLAKVCALVIRHLRSYAKPSTTEKAEPVRYMAPGDRQLPRWLLTYDDVDRVWSVFEDGADALEAYERSRSLGWNCYLWGICAKTTNAPAALPESALAELSDEQCDAAIREGGLWHLTFAAPQNLARLRSLCRFALAAAKRTPCGECHLSPGERCDICGARGKL